MNNKKYWLYVYNNNTYSISDKENEEVFENDLKENGCEKYNEEGISADEVIELMKDSDNDFSDTGIPTEIWNKMDKELKMKYENLNPRNEEIKKLADEIVSGYFVRIFLPKNLDDSTVAKNNKIIEKLEKNDFTVDYDKTGFEYKINCYLENDNLKESSFTTKSSSKLEEVKKLEKELGPEYGFEYCINLDIEKLELKDSQKKRLIKIFKDLDVEVEGDEYDILYDQIDRVELDKAQAIFSKIHAVTKGYKNNLTNTIG
ncbi:MAG: hypothetical protein ACRC4M_02650 [Mycoplasma sp.]